jgi:selenophosphate synthetase-related protein
MQGARLSKTYRDVDFVRLDKDLYMLVACDSAGGIGEKQMDVVKVPPYVVGRFTCRVALMEVFAVGGMPIAATAAICSEPSPTGDGIIRGINDELSQCELSLPLTISSEKNIPTCQTGLGVTVIGIARQNELRVHKTRAGDKLYCIGIPKAGSEVSLHDPQIAHAKLTRYLNSILEVHDIIPVGSKGIKGEAEMLVSSLGLKLDWERDLPVDIQKTAGPATCILVTSSNEFELDCTQPVYLLAQVTKID